MDRLDEGIKNLLIFVAKSLTAVTALVIFFRLVTITIEL